MEWNYSEVDWMRPMRRRKLGTAWNRRRNITSESEQFGLCVCLSVRRLDSSDLLASLLQLDLNLQEDGGNHAETTVLHVVRGGNAQLCFRLLALMARPRLRPHRPHGRAHR